VQAIESVATDFKGSLEQETVKHRITVIRNDHKYKIPFFILFKIFNFRQNYLDFILLDLAIKNMVQRKKFMEFYR
jgi:uncharacterized protein involved in tolerance to divalent cations